MLTLTLLRFSKVKMTTQSLYLFRSILTCIFVLINLCDASTSSWAQSPLSISISEAVQPLLKGYQGDVAVAVYHFESDSHWSVRGDVVMPTASLIKLPVMVEAYRQVAAGKVMLDQRIELKKEDMVQGSGILTSHFSPGTTISLRDAIRLMIVYSDNTATNLVVDAIGLPSTTAAMKELGYPETQLHSKVFRRDVSIAPERSEKYGLGSTTAIDMVNLVTRLKRGELAGPEATAAMLDHLVNCDDKSRFPLLLPSTVKVAHKTGSVTRVRTDAGLLMGPGCTIALCVLTDNNKDIRWTDDNAGNKLSADIAKSVYELLAPKTTDKAATTDQAKAMRIGATGDLVEALQRTLKARLSPPSAISVDGDFGPATEGAVKAFQKQEKLEATGVVDAATWRALGPLLDQEKPMPAPQIVNSEKLEKKASDDPFGPPQVTCTAWTIVEPKPDGSMPRFLPIAGNNSDVPMHIASTTKIMTAYVILKMAASHPEILEEVLTFSKRADDTVGSTAGVRAGESLIVGELMYGLMLPSGNDASVALAEHFGRKFVKTDESLDDAKSYDRFIEQMNATARELEMMHTHFVNPHGLTDKAHLSTADDLASLAIAALGVPHFRDYVTCRQHGCEVTGAGGYKRNLKWENTNRLLGIEGYTGLKTGTTDAAGACLVSCSQRGDRELIVVLLNAANSDARYVDARNLHAFGWRTANDREISVK